MPLTPEVVRELTRKYAQTDPSAVYFTILKEGGIPIGNTQLFKIHPWSKHAEFGIWIGDKTVWGQGYATEVTGVVLDFAFGRLNLHKVYLTVDADNPGAIRSYEKAGFKKDGVLRDEVYKNGQYVDRLMMSILKHEYPSKSNNN